MMFINFEAFVKPTKSYSTHLADDVENWEKIIFHDKFIFQYYQHEIFGGTRRWSKVSTITVSYDPPSIQLRGEWTGTFPVS